MEGRASRILGQKPRSVGEGREKIIERVGRLGLQGQVLLTHLSSPSSGAELGCSWGRERERGWTEPRVGPGVRWENRPGARNLFGE